MFKSLSITGQDMLKYISDITVEEWQLRRHISFEKFQTALTGANNQCGNLFHLSFEKSKTNSSTGHNGICVPWQHTLINRIQTHIELTVCTTPCLKDRLFTLDPLCLSGCGYSTYIEIFLILISLEKKIRTLHDVLQCLSAWSQFLQEKKETLFASKIKKEIYPKRICEQLYLKISKEISKNKIYIHATSKNDIKTCWVSVRDLNFREIGDAYAFAVMLPPQNKTNFGYLFSALEHALPLIAHHYETWLCGLNTLRVCWQNYWNSETALNPQMFFNAEAVIAALKFQYPHLPI